MLLLRGVFLERAACVLLAEDAFGQGQQFAAAHLADPPTRRQHRAMRVRVQVVGGGQLVLQQRAMAHRHEHEHRDVAQQRPEHAMRQRIPAAQSEQRFRAQPALPERAVQHPRRRRTVGLQQGGKQQAPCPQQRAREQTRIRAGAARATPVQAADQGRRELRHRGEGEQAVLRQHLLAQRMAVIGEGEQREHDDRDAADQQHALFDVGAVVQQAATQQQRHDEVVTHHRRQGHAGHDHHAGRRRQAADVGHQRQPFVAMRKRERQHVAVGRHRVRARHRLAGQRDRQHHGTDQREIAHEHPARGLQVGRILALDHGHVELPGQADDGQEAQQGLGQESRWQLRRREGVQARRHPCGEVVGAGQVPQREQADRDERDQLDQRFQRDRQHHAAMVLGGIDAPRAEQDREHRQHQRHVQRGIDEPLRGRWLAAEHAHAHAHGLELQCEIRDRRDHRDHRDHGRQSARAAIARRQEVGDRHDAVLAGCKHQPFLQAPAEQQQQDRSQVDRQEAQAGSRGGAHCAIERPRGAVHRERQRIHRRPQAWTLRQTRMAFAQPGHGEQQAHVGQCHQQQEPAGHHRVRASLFGEPAV